MSQLPIIGPIFFQQSLLVYGAFLMVPLATCASSFDREWRLATNLVALTNDITKGRFGLPTDIL